MRQFNKHKGIKGIKTIQNLLSQYRYITDKEKEVIQFRAKILDHYHKYGMDSTIDAFNVSKRSVFRWNNVLKKDNRTISLKPQSTKPKSYRVSKIPDSVRGYIKSMKQTIPKIGKDKLVVLIKKHLNYVIGNSTVGRIINDLKSKGELNKFQRVSYYASSDRHNIYIKHKISKIRRKGYAPTKQGELIQMDSIILHFNGKKYYVITAIDVYTRKTWTTTTLSHSSIPTRDLLINLKTEFPDVVVHVQTDNGSEFYKHFEEACVKLDIVHFWNYPRSPKSNAFIERFNRTLKEEFIYSNKHLLNISVPLFNQSMQSYVSWYNTDRPHWSLGFLSPQEYIKSINSKSAKC